MLKTVTKADCYYFLITHKLEVNYVVIKPKT